MAFQLTSTFDNDSQIPVRYASDGENLSPPLEWRNPPVNVRSFAVVVVDPDAPPGTVTHWLLYDLPAESRSLPEGVAPVGQLPDGSRQGENSWGRLGYSGPRPWDTAHGYFFKLYALDRCLGLHHGATRLELRSAIGGHILAEADLMGWYGGVR